MIDDPKIRREINELKQGLTFVAGELTLTNSSTTTTVTRQGVSASSCVGLTPYTVAAKTEGIPQCVPSNGAFTLTHSNALTTRTYRYVVHTPQ
jgi:hypothetical protein